MVPFSFQNFSKLFFVVLAMFCLDCSQSGEVKNKNASVKSSKKIKRGLSYEIKTHHLNLISADSLFKESYQYPQLNNLADTVIEKKVNDLLKNRFLPEEQYIAEYEKNVIHLHNEQTSPTYWESTESGYSVGLALKNFICIKHKITLRNEKTKHPKFEINHYNINLQTGELIENLSYFFVEGYENELEKLLNTPSQEEDEDRDFYLKLDPRINYAFGFSEQGSTIRLEVYIPSNSDFAILKNGKTKIVSNDYLPKTFSVALNDIVELIKTDAVFNGITVK